MSNRPDAFMPLWIGDYLKDTAHLTVDQHGAYLLLLMAYWCRGSALPADDQYLARVVRVTPQKWRSIRQTIAAFFDERDGAWHSERADKELAKAQAGYERRAAAGRLGAEAKKVKGTRARYVAPTSGLARTPEPAHETEQVFLAETSQSDLSNASGNAPALDQQSQSHRRTRTLSSSSQNHNSEAIASEPKGSNSAIGDLFVPKVEPVPPKPSTPLDLETELWRTGKLYLIEHGVSKAQAGALIGKWRKALGNDDLEVMRVLRRSQAECAAEPVAFIEGMINHQRKANANGRANGKSGQSRSVVFDDAFEAYTAARAERESARH
jgi:uncharacterized protein YdaU (DUF1376 family)